MDSVRWWTLQHYKLDDASNTHTHHTTHIPALHRPQYIVAPENVNFPPVSFTITARNSIDNKQQQGVDKHKHHTLILPE